MAVRVLDMKLNCQDCDKAMKKERGCTGKGQVPFDIDGETHFRCPIKLVTVQSWQYIRAYAFYKRGILPSGKGWIHESDKYLTAMTTIGSEVSKMQEEAHKKAMRKQRKR